MKIRFLILAPYKSMQATIQDIRSQYPDIDIDVFVGTYSDYLENQASIDIQSYDGFLARGYTYQMLKTTIAVPLTEIKISLYDMLRIITAARMRKVPFAIVASMNILEPARQIMDILQYTDIDICEIKSEEEADAAVATLSRKGVKLIIGDVYADRSAKKQNISSMLVTSSRVSICNAIDDAVNTHNQHQEAYRQLLLFNAALRSCPAFSVIYSASEKRIISNLNEFPVPFSVLEPILLRSIKTMTAKRADTDLVKVVDGWLFRISGRLLQCEDTFYIFYILAEKAPIMDEKQGLQVLYPSETAFSSILENKYQFPLQYTQESSYRLPTKIPTVIVGEVGLSKSLLAEYFWYTSSPTTPLIILDSSILTAKALRSEWKNLDSPIHDVKCALLVKDLQELAPDVQELLCLFLEDTSFSDHNLLLVTSTIHPRTLMENGRLITRLCDYLHGNLIEIENLNNRPDDLTIIVDYLITKYNMQFGKEVIGLMDDALETLKEFPWKSNLNQLKAVLRQLVSNSNDLFISKSSVDDALKNIESRPVFTGSFDLSGSLSEIEARIVHAVLEEEKMNFAATARRLGISRATLYRKAET